MGRLKAINDTEERKVVQEEMEKMEAKHNAHEKLKHPMTKEQLEEVWEDQDHMDPQDWDPKTFFNMHDLDGNGQWDENEVRVLFKKELDKAYDPNAPEDDMREREEEMERMREHVFKESDSDKNHMISFDEFLAETQRDEFEKDPGWDTMDDEELYTDEEFQEFEHEREAQMPQGYGAYPNIPAMPPVGYGHPGGMPPQGYPPQPNMYPPHPQAAMYPAQQMGGVPQQQPPIPQMGMGGVPQGYAAHPNFAPGPPMPGIDRNGVPMHGSVPGQPANPQQRPGQQPAQQEGQPLPQGGQPLPQGGQPLPQGGQQFQPQGGQPIPQQPVQQGGQPIQQGGQPVQQGGQQPAQGGQPVQQAGQQNP